jgi:hypothetical protein
LFTHLEPSSEGPPNSDPPFIASNASKEELYTARR